MTEHPIENRARVNRAILDAVLDDSDPKAMARTIGEMAGALACVPGVEAAEILAIVHVAAWAVVDHLKEGVAGERARDDARRLCRHPRDRAAAGTGRFRRGLRVTDALTALAFAIDSVADHDFDPTMQNLEQVLAAARGQECQRSRTFRGLGAECMRSLTFHPA
ncbi:hypothetical protein [Lichenifustis flavocetrariae]|uniref:Uncharacterized protein n=1 Tax=Lichenifustis flavocetrariae TaxID=2949735 RepID=A0AA41YR94_9HYPH|nr:hypothetical protein [Lichenifustis flavocetrariae]MCW6507086.1 hypothetical protein [Lichenifustis flavocetrariae]